MIGFKTVSCNGAAFTVPELLDFRCPNVPSCKPIISKNPWNVLHERYADAIRSNRWDEAYERKWLDEVFVGLVPCGPCRERWKPISDAMDLSTAENAFTAAWQAHNRVSTTHVEPPLPEIPYEQCRNLWLGPKVAFIAVNYASHGGTETFHQTLLPALRHFRNVIGFAAMTGGGDSSLLKVPYYEGSLGVRQLCEQADIVVTWGIDALTQLLPQPRPKVIAVHHGDVKAGWIGETMWQGEVDKFVCVNREAAEYIKTNRNLPVHYIPNAINPERLKTTAKLDSIRQSVDGKKVVLFGHRMSEEKRPELAVEIASHLPDDWILVMAGDGILKPKSTPQNIRLVGHVETLADWLNVSHCFISLSTFEGFGLSMAEAHAANVPIIATPVGIAKEVASQILPISASAKEWADSIVSTCARALRNKVADYSVDRHVAEWVKVLS